MTGSVERPIAHLEARGRLWWLPVEGFGNGLEDASWAPILDVDTRVISALLDALRQANVPAFASPSHTVTQRLRRTHGQALSYRVWVGASRYSAAETTLLRVLPDLNRRCLPRDDKPRKSAVAMSTATQAIRGLQRLDFRGDQSTALTWQFDAGWSGG
jgi:hypothetical protein